MRILVDFSTLNAVESNFRPGLLDPWSVRLSGQLADAYAYGSVIETPWPTHDKYESAGVMSPGSRLEDALYSHDTSRARPNLYRTDDVVTLRPEFMLAAVESLTAWAGANPATLKRWIDLHWQDWIRRQYVDRLPHGRVYESIDDPRLGKIDRELDLPGGGSSYALDMVLRYPFYGALTGADGFYLNHPLRDAIQLPGVGTTKTKPPIGISFDKSVRSLTPHMELDDYVGLLQEIREVVLDLRLDKLGSGQIDRDTLRSVAARLRFPPKLRAQAKLASSAVALIGGVGAVPALGPMAAVGGAIVGIATTHWQGQLPRAAAGWGWAKWALEWEIEKQADDRDG